MGTVGILNVGAGDTKLVFGFMGPMIEQCRPRRLVDSKLGFGRGPQRSDKLLQRAGWHARATSRTAFP